jgi:predicted nucleic acid-binding protein
VWAYFDSSAVVRVYVQEGGRAAVLRLLRQHEVVASAILPVEIRGALRPTSSGKCDRKLPPPFGTAAVR